MGAAHRCDVACTAVVALVVLLIFGTTEEANATLTKAAGWVTLGFAGLGIHLFLSTASLALGGRGYPLGQPTLKESTLAGPAEAPQGRRPRSSDHPPSPVS